MKKRLQKKAILLAISTWADKAKDSGLVRNAHGVGRTNSVLYSQLIMLSCEARQMAAQL